MDNRERNRYEMLIGVESYGTENTTDFAAIPAAVENFDVVRQVIAGLRDYAATQTSGAIGRTTERKAVLRDAVRDKMKGIARTARAAAIDNAGFNRLFRIPDGNNDQLLIAAAREFVSEATNFKAELLRFALPADFIEDLEEDITAFENILNEKAQASGERVSATASIDDEIERGMNAARRLDAIVRNIYRDNPAKLAAWTTARHVRRTPRTPAPPVQPTA